MESITVNGVITCNGKPVKTTWELAKRTDGTWYRKGFSDVLQKAHDTSKSSTVRPIDCDTYVPELINRTELSDQEIAELASKYDIHNMTQDQYNAFLDELVEKGTLTKADTMWLGRSGLQRVDVNLDVLFTKGMAPGPITISSTEDFNNIMKESLEDADGDLIVWLESMLARQKQGANGGTSDGSGKKGEALNTLLDIVKQM
mgnify:CR=1 FL=1